MCVINNHNALFLLAFFLLTVFFVSCYAADQASTPPTPQPIAQVVWVNGTMKAVGPDNKERVLQRKDFIYAHDTISTDAGSTGQIVFTDNGLIAFKENTTIRVDEYKFTNGAAHDQDRFGASLVKGGFRSITGAISKGKPENYKMSSPVATIGVRGTNYMFAYDPTSGASAGVSEGKIYFYNDIAGVDLAPDMHPYAVIQEKTRPPLYVEEPPSALSSIPAVTKVQASPELNKAAGIASSTNATGSTTTTTGSSGGAQTVKSFTVCP